jgi:hypothetical protein
MDDLYPDEFEVLIGSLVILLREEKDVEKQIDANNKDIKDRVKNVLIPPTDLDISQCTDLVNSDFIPSPEVPNDYQPPPPPPPQPLPQSQEEESPELESASTVETETSPLVKKLFKQIALHTHPDKVKDERLNKLFLLGRKAQEQNDVLTLLFILSKSSPKNLLEDDDLTAVKAMVGQRQNSLNNRKNTVTYKWNTYSDAIKETLIQKIIVK